MAPWNAWVMRPKILFVSPDADVEAGARRGGVEKGSSFCPCCGYWSGMFEMSWFGLRKFEAGAAINVVLVGSDELGEDVHGFSDDFC